MGGIGVMWSGVVRREKNSRTRRGKKEQDRKRGGRRGRLEDSVEEAGGGFCEWSVEEKGEKRRGKNKQRR